MATRRLIYRKLKVGQMSYSEDNRMFSSREQVLAKMNLLPKSPVAFEAIWDGDSSGWFILLLAVMKSKERYEDFWLGTMNGGSNMQIINGIVPPWGEVALVREIGEELAARFGVPFYFPSPDNPEYECPRWWEQ